MKLWFRCISIKIPSILAKVGGLAGAVLFLSSMTASTGCESGSFIPPPPDELRGSAGGPTSGSTPSAADWQTEPVETKAVELILDRRDPADEAVEAAAARTQAGLDTVKLKIAVLAGHDLPARQVDLVRQAVARRPLALIVEPADPTDRRLAQAIDAARGEGIPVVLLNRPVAGDQAAEPGSASTSTPPGAGSAQPGARQAAATTPSPGSSKPIVVVKSPPFASSAEQLVASAVRNAKNAHLDPHGEALILVNSVGDPLIPERTLAIRKALEAVGIKAVQEIAFSKQVELGVKLVTERLKADPKLMLVFSVDNLSSTATRQVMADIVLKRPFIIAGYASDENYANSTQMGDFAALAEYMPSRLVRKAISIAAALAHGRDVPKAYELPIIVHDSPADSTTGKSPTYGKQKQQMAK